MAQLTKDTPLVQELGSVAEVPVKASTKIYEGSAVGIDAASGYARPLVAGDRFVGFAESQADNSAGANGAINVRVIAHGRVKQSIGSLVVTDIGKPVYASDGATFTLTQGANSYVGVVTRFTASGVGIISYDAEIGGLITELTDSTTGTADDTVADVGASFNQATLNNNFADLTAKVNSILRMLK